MKITGFFLFENHLIRKVEGEPKEFLNKVEKLFEIDNKGIIFHIKYNKETLKKPFVNCSILKALSKDLFKKEEFHLLKRLLNM